MPFDMVTLRNAVYQTLLDNNTTTSANYLSTDLSSAVAVIPRASPQGAPIGLQQMNAVHVFPLGYEDDYADMGNVPRRRVQARIGVVGTVYGTTPQGSEGAENNLNHLMRNVSRIFRVDHRLDSQTTFALSSTVIGLRQEIDFEYEMPGGGDSSYALSAIDRLTIELLTT